MQIADGSSFEWTAKYLCRVLEDLASIETGVVDELTPFAEMGVDSFRILKIIKRLESDFGILPKTLLFEHVNIDELSRYFVERHDTIVASLMGTIDEPIVNTHRPISSGQGSLNSDNLIRPDRFEHAARSTQHVKSALPDGPLTLLENEARSHQSLGSIVTQIFNRFKNEAGASRGARSIAPNIFIGSERDGYFNYSRCRDILLAYAYTGPEAAFEKIAAELLAYCLAHDLQLNIFSDRSLGQVGDVPFSATPFGLLQRVVDLDSFTLEGSSMKRLRYLVQKFGRLGKARTEEYRLGESADTEAQIGDVIDRWCATKPMVNPLIGIVRDEILNRTLDPAHRLFLTWLDDTLHNVILISPLGSDYGGYLMDLEFYDRAMPLGGLEFAITNIIDCLVAENCNLLSLGGTYGCRIEVGADADPAIDRALDDLHAQGIFDDQGNMQFKNKFRPSNRSIYLCRPVGSSAAENIVDIIMMIADPVAMQTSDAPNFSCLEAGQFESSPPLATAQHRSSRQDGSAGRADQLAVCGHNPANLAAEAVPFDLRTDSWAQLHMPIINARMEELRAQLQLAAPVNQALGTLFPFSNFVLTASGRAADELLYASLDPKGAVIENLLFPTGLFHQIDSGFDPIELPRAETLDPLSHEIFKGDVDLVRVCTRIEAGDVVLACVEATNNAAGGLPISMKNLSALKELLTARGVPLVIDATRILDNAHFVIAHETGFSERNAWDVARQMLGYADVVTCSLAKTFGLDRGGLIATNDTTLFEKLNKTLLERGGALDAIGRKLVALALQDRRWIEIQVARRIETVQLLGEALRQGGLPLAEPTGGHALLVDIRQIPAFRELEHPVPSFLAWLYMATGIRAGAHSVGMQKRTPINDLVRIAVPVGIKASEIEKIAQQLITQFATLENVPDLTLATGNATASDPFAQFVLRALHNPAVTSNTTEALEDTALASTRSQPSTSIKSVVADSTLMPVRSYHKRDIAIVGMAGRYPDADTLDQLWQNISVGKDSIRDIPPARRAYRPGGTYPDSYRGGFINDIDRFDSLFFNISPRDAELLDPQERLFLEVAWEAVEDAGYTPDTLTQPGTPRDIGVYVGAVWTMYQMYGVEAQQSGQQLAPNSFLWSIANHVSYCLNLCGPSMTVDTACSSSLTALYLACEAIYKGECSAAIVGGVNLDLHPGKLAINLLGGALSPDGICRTFGKDANGYVAGEGVGAVLIKPLEDAIRDCDAIHGVIKGIAINHGGRSNGYAVPSPRAQTDVVRAALDCAGIDATGIDYIEAHGTGTELGDPIEIRALTSAFECAQSEQQSCAIGSVKSNVGHLEAAAGIIGISKVLLQMRHRQLVPSLHASETNEFIDFANSPFRVVQQLESWPTRFANGQRLPMRAGVSSFGAGGSNAHVVLESYDDLTAPDLAGVAQVFPLSARSETQLRQQAERLRDHLAVPAPAQQNSHNLAAIARTLQLGRIAHEHRAAIVAAGVPELIAALDCLIAGKADNALVLGNVQASGSIGRMLSALEQDQFTELLSSSGDCLRLARLWVDGAFSRWNGIIGKTKGPRAHLPTYSFADRRHWIGGNIPAVLAPRTWSNTLHPLIDANVSTFERQIFTKRFHVGDFFIHDHVVSDIPTLPGVAYLEFARKAGELAAGQPVRRIRNILWLSPIAVRDGKPVDVQIELKASGTVVQFEVFSVDNNESRTPHAQGQLLFTASNENTNQSVDISRFRERAERTIDGPGVYPNLEAAGLKLGPSFQVLQEVYSAGSETLGRLMLSPERQSDLGVLALHPALVDGALQTGVASQLDGETSEMAVPYSIGEVEIFHPLPAECWSHVTVVSNSESRLRRANVTITDAEGQILVQLRETIGVPLTDVHKRGAEPVLCYTPDWTDAEPPTPEPYDGVTLWFDADQSRALRAAERIGVGGELVTLANAEPEAFAELIARLEKEGRELRRICWALPLSQLSDSLDADSHDSDILALMPLMKALTVRKHGYKLPVVYAFTNETGFKIAEHEAVGGFARALRLEDPKIQIKTLALSGEARRGDALIDALLRESADGNDVSVRFDGTKRQVRAMRAAMLPTASDSMIREHGTYVITGGAGGLGLIFARHLARTFKAKLVLTGRSELSSELAMQLAELEAGGAEVLYLRADVADPVALAAALDEARARFGPLSGVIHSAGVLRDSYMRNKTLDDMRAVLAPKVAGTRALDSATRDDPLDLFVMFSSMSSVGGNPGQTDYCYANAFLDAFAAERELLRKTGERSGRTLSLNWSLWAEGGMRLDAQSEQMFRNATGIRPLATSAGVDAFIRALAAPEPQLLIVDGDRERIETSLGLRKPAPNTTRRPTQSTSAPQGSEDAVVKMLRDGLSQIVIDQLKLSPEDLETSKILLDLGFDSIGLAGFANAVNEQFDLEITPILFFDYPSIDEIVRHLASEQMTSLVRFLDSEPQSARPVLDPPALGATSNPLQTKSQIAAIPKPSFTQTVTADDDVIAIVGISGTMPRSANVSEFWENLREGRDLIDVVPPDRWIWEEHFGDPLREPNKTNSKWGGFVNDVDKFDPLFFGISPLEARMMDPQQRLFLQNVWEAVEDSGHKIADLAGTRTGLFVGVATSDYVNIINRQKIGINAYTASGNSHAMLANRVSYLLNLRGPSAPIDTACSSSLIALHRASEAIRAGDCDMAIVGGVQVMLTPAAHVSFAMAGMLSPDGRCKSFDKNANGYVRGEGSGAVFLKRLADAEADGDHIYAVVRSTSENHGGRVTTLTAPNAAAQTELIVQSYLKAGIDPATVGFIECHGTGTALGDPIEVQALSRAFAKLYESAGKVMPTEPHCGLSSVKTNIGHLETAAGIASVLTTVLAIKHRQIPANLHLEEINPYINLENTPFYVADKTTEWHAPKDENGLELPRRAGISSFGFGGANAHIVLEEYILPKFAISQGKVPRIFVLSAKNIERLRVYVERLITHIDTNDLDADEVAWTLQVGRDAFSERLAVIASCLTQLRAGLVAFLSDESCSGLRSASGVRQLSAEQTLDFADLDAIADGWIAGAQIEWSRLYAAGTPRRVALPTYPFARERYWITETTTPNSEEANDASFLHPLVHHNVSTLSEQRYTSRFDGSESFLRDHVVEGQRIMPGVAYVEMARFAGSLGAGRDVSAIRKLVWLVPLIISETGDDVSITLVPRRDELEFRITSLAGDGFVTHCTGILEFDQLESELFFDVEAVRSRVGEPVLGHDTLYRYFETSGLALGASFRLVDNIRANGNEAFAELSVPAEAAREAASYLLHPGLMDGSLHSAIGLMKSGDVDPPLSLPFSVGDISIYGSLQNVRYSYASWVKNSSQDDPNHWKVDFLLLDAAGKILVAIRNFSSKPLHRGQTVMLRSTTKNDSPEKVANAAPQSTLWKLVPYWAPLHLKNSTPLPIGRSILLVSEERAASKWLNSGFPDKSVIAIQPAGDTAELTTQIADADFDELVWVAPSALNDPILAQESGVLGAFSLTKALLAAGYGGRKLSWTLVVCGTQSVHADDHADPAHASLFGYVRCLAKEYPQWTLRLVDIESFDDVSAQEALSLPRSEAEIGLAHRGGEWLYRDLAVLKEPGTAPARIRQGGVFVIIGGAGGIGRLWSAHLAAVNGAQLVWIGRREPDAVIQDALEAVAKVGPRPLYISADATDAVALARAREQILAQYGMIHGVIHSALVLADRSVAQMSREEFTASLACKVDVCVNIDKVFGELDLDFVMLFSSIVTLRGSAGQSNYAAGCAFKDAFARTMQRRRSYPVKVINWGYWGDVGIVADESHRRAMAQLGIGSIDPNEGLAQINMSLAAPIDQIAILKTIGTQAALSFAELERIELPRYEATTIVDSIASKWMEADENSLRRLRSDLPSPDQDSLVAEILAATLGDQGQLDGRRTALRYRRWLDGSLAYLRDGGWIDATGAALRPIRPLPALWNEWKTLRPVWRATHPNHDSQTDLLEVCLENLSQVLIGDISATEVLFPNASFALVESVYRGTALSDHFNTALGQMLDACIDRWLAAQPQRRIRILEIGAGTGGTTAGLLPIIGRYGDSIEEYCFTDLSKAFLLSAKKRFISQLPIITTELFDVSKPLAEQNISPGRYDIVIASNVLHATANIRATIRNAKAALVQGGVMLLNEISSWSAFSHLTFGLLDGWWCFEDPALRIPHCPGLSPNQWKRLLKDEGFDEIFFPASLAHSFGQQIIAASSDGVLRHAAPTATTAPVVTVPTVRMPHQAATVPFAAKSNREETRKVMRYEQVKAIVAGTLSDVLQLEKERIVDDEPFAEYGVDSIIGVNLVRQIADTLEIDLDPTALFEHVSVRQLSEHILATSSVQRPSDEPATPHNQQTKFAENSTVGWRTAEEPVARFMPPQSHARLELPTEDAIAIIGVSGRFAQSDTLETFWHNLDEGRDLIGEVTRWRPEDSALAATQSGPYCRHGGFISSAELFDPAFFNIPQGEALCMDPQHRLFLEESWRALEDAGYANKDKREVRCGVFVGCGSSKYDTLLGEEQPAHTFWGNSEAVLPARIAYHLDLQGPAVAVNTACSSSLVTIHLASQSLRTGETDMCLAGGVFLQPTPGFYQVANRAGMLSREGKCFAFDARADGFVPGEGVGVVVLKRLADAKAAGDHIHGVIIGSAVGQDGASNGIIAPNGAAQERLESELYERYAIQPDTISLLEAHGTGTIIGDAIEFGAVTRAFRKQTDRTRFCAISSVKANIGHAATAAGVASVLKVVLAMRHRRIPASINFTQANTGIDLDQSPFYVPTVSEDWGPSEGSARRAAVSSFGFSGTNGHLVIEEAPERVRHVVNHPGYLIALSARTKQQLMTLARELYLKISEDIAISIADVSFTLLAGRARLRERMAFVASDSGDLLQKLGGWLEHGTKAGVHYASLDEASTNPRAALTKFGSFCIDQYRMAGSAEALEHLETLADLFVQGCSVEYDRIFDRGEVGRVPLPTYPFARERYWPDNRLTNQSAPTVPASGLINGLDYAHCSKPVNLGTSVEQTTFVELWLQNEISIQLDRRHNEIDHNLPFFDLGLTSLGITDLVRKLNDTLDISIQPSNIFDYPTIRTLSAWINENFFDRLHILESKNYDLSRSEKNKEILRNVLLDVGKQELVGYEKLTF